tara:strand:- start:1216 stop:1758 length:543 start_codon:yes stop_codon:yes gene_type:complete
MEKLDARSASSCSLMSEEEDEYTPAAYIASIANKSILSGPGDATYVAERDGDISLRGACVLDEYLVPLHTWSSQKDLVAKILDNLAVCIGVHGNQWTIEKELDAGLDLERRLSVAHTGTTMEAVDDARYDTSVTFDTRNTHVEDRLSSNFEEGLCLLRLKARYLLIQCRSPPLNAPASVQ